MIIYLDDMGSISEESVYILKSKVTISNSIFGYALIYIPLGIICSFPWFKKEIRKDKADSNGIMSSIGYLVLFFVCIVYIISSSYK